VPCVVRDVNAASRRRGRIGKNLRRLGLWPDRGGDPTYFACGRYAAFQSTARIEVREDEWYLELTPQSLPHRTNANAALCDELDSQLKIRRKDFIPQVTGFSGQLGSVRKGV
jgi:hypothetical protein